MSLGHRKHRLIDDIVRSFLPGCRRHGRSCTVPWGYDPDHTDTDRPYTLDELATRISGPHRYAYPDAQAYLEGWALWKALRRDSRLTRTEVDVVFNLQVQRVIDELRGQGRVTALLERFLR